MERFLKKTQIKAIRQANPLATFQAFRPSQEKHFSEKNELPGSEIYKTCLERNSKANPDANAGGSWKRGQNHNSFIKCVVHNYLPEQG